MERVPPGSNTKKNVGIRVSEFGVAGRVSSECVFAYPPNNLKPQLVTQYPHVDSERAQLSDPPRVRDPIRVEVVRDLPKPVLTLSQGGGGVKGKYMYGKYKSTLMGNIYIYIYIGDF